VRGHVAVAFDEYLRKKKKGGKGGGEKKQAGKGGKEEDHELRWAASALEPLLIAQFSLPSKGGREKGRRRKQPAKA